MPIHFRSYHFPWTMGGKEKLIFQSMDEWSSKTCIKFTRRGSQLHRSVGHGHYIEIKGLTFLAEHAHCKCPNEFILH